MWWKIEDNMMSFLFAGNKWKVKRWTVVKRSWVDKSDKKMKGAGIAQEWMLMFLRLECRIQRRIG